METSKQSTGETLFDLTSYVADTHASLSAQQANAKEQTTLDTFGLGLDKPLANYDPDTQSWKMYEATYLWGDCPLLENLPASGMTQNGALFPQPAWVPITSATVSLSWPTPRANPAMASTITLEIANNPNRQPNLETVVGRRQWPTPTAHPDNSNVNGKFANPTLGDAVRMWPTPTVDDSKNVNPKPNRRPGLVAEVNSWPTPTESSCGNEGLRMMLDKKIAEGSITQEDKKAMTAGNGGKLNPMWVEWLMGFPLGWTDLEDSETP
jgi:DNA (cytosine-5)-methyltransferase 1